MKFFIHILLFLFAAAVNAQTEEPLAIADSMPKFQGGTMEMAKHIQRNFAVPPEVRETSNSAKAFIKFVVDTNGKVVSPSVAKSSGNKEFDMEAVRVISTMPLWEPGLDKNKKVRVYMIVPVSWKDGGIVQPPAETEEHKKAMAYYQEGRKLSQDERHAEALKKFEQTLAIEPANAFALYDKAKTLRMMGEKIKACEIWNKMISSNIRKEEAQKAVQNNCNPETINVPVDLVKEKEAREANKKATETFNLGLSQVRQGRYEAALNSFDKSLEYEPTHNGALYNKALMHLKLGNKVKACETWNKMVTINEKDQEVKELIKKNCN